MGGEIVKQLFGTLKPSQTVVMLFLLFIVGLFLALVGIVGLVPVQDGTGKFIVLSDIQKNLFIGIGIVTLLVMLFILITLARISGTTANPSAEKVLNQRSPEYVEQFKKENEPRKTPTIVVADDLIVERKIKNTNMAVIIGDIVNARTDAIVSSDDNHFSALGGVAIAIREKAGEKVVEQLQYYRDYRPVVRQGSVAVTTGGDLNSRIIIHPATIDVDFNRFPNEDTIKQLVKRIFTCADIMGLKSVAIPVIGGGTANKYLKQEEIIPILLQEISLYITAGTELEQIELYIHPKVITDAITKSVKALMKNIVT